MEGNKKWKRLRKDGREHRKENRGDERKESKKEGMKIERKEGRQDGRKRDRTVKPRVGGRIRRMQGNPGREDEEKGDTKQDKRRNTKREVG